MSFKRKKGIKIQAMKKKSAIKMYLKMFLYNLFFPHLLNSYKKLNTKKILLIRV